MYMVFSLSPTEGGSKIDPAITRTGHTGEGLLFIIDTFLIKENQILSSNLDTKNQDKLKSPLNSTRYLLALRGFFYYFFFRSAQY